ncbi:MAG TPA: TolC family protein, partial [Acidobacteria bacterium]|nr:TolC family protein [Acidobacteriota bacterium]
MSVSRTILCSFVAISLSVTAFAGDGETPPSTLTSIVRSALHTNEVMERADSRVRRAAADVKLAGSAVLPRFDLNGRYTRFQKEVSFDVGGGQSFVLQPLGDWNYSADLRQTLFYGLRDWRARDVAKLHNTVARINRLSTASDLVLQVSQAFFDAVAAEQRVGVRKTTIDQVKEQRRVARRRFEVGELTSADVARWTAQLAAERQALVVAEGQAELARQRLARLAGVPKIGQLNPPPTIPPPEGSDDELRHRALEERPEMASLDTQLEAAGLMIKVEKGAWLPEIDAHLQYVGQRSDFPSNNWLSLTFNLRIPVYDGGLTAARVAKAKEDLVEVDVLRRSMIKSILDQADLAIISYRTAVAALEASQTRRDAAREAHRQVDRAYSVGEATATDLLSATTELTDARISAIIAHWTREVAAIALRHAIGAPPVPGVQLPGALDEPAGRTSPTVTPTPTP